MTEAAGIYRPYLMADVRRASAARLFTVASTFAGGGGSSIGYRLAGGWVALANEFVPEAARTYRANFPDTVVDQRNIREITTDPAAIEAFLAQANLAPRDLDILDGSPPCNEFCHLGPGIRDQRLLLPYSDVRQRGSATLIFDFALLVRTALPKVFIVENVVGMKSALDLFSNAVDALRFSSSPRARLYYVNWAVLSAENFGVPQKRKRLIIIGVRKDVAEAVGIADDAGVSAVFPAPTHAPVSVRAALAGVERTYDDVYPWDRAMMTTPLGGFVRLLPRDPEKCTGLADVGFRKNFKFTLKRCAWNLPAPTLTALDQHPDGRSGLIHPDQDRKFTIPELKRLTTLPDDFALTGRLGQAAERMGQMVPPLMTKAVADAVYERVLRLYIENRGRKAS